MDKEKILLDALNTFGNFTNVEEEFNSNQLEVIYEVMDLVVEQTEQLCGNLDENYNCKNMCLTRCVDGYKFYK